MRRGVLLFAAASVGITAGGAALATADVGQDALAAQIGTLFSLTGAALFFGAGLLRLARWRAFRDSRSLLMGSALVVLGGISIPMTGLATILTSGDTSSHLRSATSIATMSVVFALVLRALTTPLDAPLPRSKRVLAGSCGVALALSACLLLAHFFAPVLLHWPSADPGLLRGTALASMWLALAYLAAVGRAERPWAGNVAPLFAGMYLSELVRINHVFFPGQWALLGVVIVSIVAAFTAHRALLDLDEATAAERERLDQVSQELASSEAGIHAQHQQREDLVHDATNALAGLRAAFSTLERYDGRLDEATTERLRAAIRGEVSHLEHLIIGAQEEQTADFSVDPVLRSVIDTRRATGLVVHYRDSGLRAHGRPGDLATALQNLLVNAQVHAADPVTVQAVQVGDRVQINVIDHGPGMHASLVATLFQRGARGPQSTGSGLGLHVSRTLMRRQDGDLVLLSHTDGCHFAISLPEARLRLSIDIPPQHFADERHADRPVDHMVGSE